MFFRILTTLPAFAALAGCSSLYDIHAVVIAGKLAFVPAETNVWGEPDCIYSISVSAVSGPAAIPTKADDARMVANGVYWNKTIAVTSFCENPFPVLYGAKLKGPPSREDQEYNVEAKPLRIGQSTR